MTAPASHVRHIDLGKNPGDVERLPEGAICIGIELPFSAFAKALGPRSKDGEVLDGTILGGDSALRRLLANDALFHARCDVLVTRGNPIAYITDTPDLKTIAAVAFLSECRSQGRWAGTPDPQTSERMAKSQQCRLAKLRRIANNESGLQMPDKIVATYRDTELNLEACVGLLDIWSNGGAPFSTRIERPLSVAVREANGGYWNALYTQLERSLQAR